MTEKKKSKSTKLTPAQATPKVCQLFLDGLTHDRIFEYARAQKWGLSEKALGEVIDRATERLVQTAAVLNLEAEVGKALGRLECLYETAMEADDTKTALAVQKEINSLLRLREQVRRDKVPKSGAQPAHASPGSVLAFSK